jgi:hypothetical protein
VDGMSIISCDDCVMQHTSTCDDCVVTFICNREPEEAVVIDVAEARAVRLLGDAGLVPPMRQVRRTGQGSKRLRGSPNTPEASGSFRGEGLHWRATAPPERACEGSTLSVSPPISTA